MKSYIKLPENSHSIVLLFRPHVETLYNNTPNTNYLTLLLLLNHYFKM